MLLAAAVMIHACEQADSKQSAASAKSTTGLSHPPDLTGWPIVDSKKRRVGTVRTRLEKGRVMVDLDTIGLPPGVHGVHIHEVAKCEAPSFESAGDHWNWTHKKHGHKAKQGHHAGDLGNLVVGRDGKGQATFTMSLKDWDPKVRGGLPIIIHAKPDDEKTDPTGKSGARIACGVLYVRRD
jgi:Cu-Zn family superoxide dismutase